MASWRSIAQVETWLRVLLPWATPQSPGDRLWMVEEEEADGQLGRRTPRLLPDTPRLLPDTGPACMGEAGEVDQLSRNR